MNKKEYWKIRKKLLIALFKFKVFVYKGVDASEKSKEYSAFRKEIIKKTIIGLVKGLVYAVILISFDKIIIKNDMFPNVDKTVFINVIVGGIGVAGVILGLYCANISSIYSSKYANASAKVSSSFQYDKLTQKCIGTIINYIIFCFVVIAEALLDYSISWVTVLGIISWSFIVIISYSLAGNRAYQLADVYGVADDSYRLLYRIISGYIKKDIFSNDANFQNHFQEVCTNQIELRKEVQQYGQKVQDNNNSSMVRFMSRNLLLVEEYWEIKRTISKGSFWFRHEGKYQKWHLTDCAETSIALRTGTILRTKDEHNYNWFEDEMFSINRSGINYLLEKEDYASLYIYLIQFETVCKSAFAYKEANYFAGQVNYLKDIIDQKSLSENLNEEQRKSFTGIVELISLLYMDFILETSQRYQEYDLNNQVKRVIKDIDSRKSLVKCGSIRGSNYIDFYEKVINEVIVEGHRLTPDWLIAQNVVKEEYIYLNSLLDVVREGIEQVFLLGQSFENKGFLFESCIIFARFYELESKLTRFINVIEHTENEFRTYQIDKSLIWDEFRISKLEETILKWKEKIPTLLLKCSSEFAIKNWENRDDYPDFLGECYNHICNDAIESIIQNNCNQFRVDFDNLSKLILLYQEYIRTDFLKNKDLYRVEFAYYMFTSPIVEWAQIGGLAILWGEFNSESDWIEVIKVSVETIYSSNKGNKLAEKLIEYIQQRDKFMMGIGYRDLLESGWNQSVANAIKESVKIETEHTIYGKRLKTKSELLNVFCESFINFGFTTDPSEVFWVLCINPIIPEDKRFQTSNSWEDRMNEQSEDDRT